jgi:drug/metabolite transporter (DMT)-like permease
MSPIGWVTPTSAVSALFASAGVTSVVALLCINRSLKLAPASVVVPYQYSMIVWAVIFGFVVWGDVPSLSTLIGAASSSARASTSSCANRSWAARKRWSIRRRDFCHPPLEGEGRLA